MRKTEAIQQFLKTSVSPIAQLYTPNMEVQVNAAKDNGVRIQGKFKGRDWQAWESPEGIEPKETWKSFRIPWNASTEPEYTDTRIRFNIAKHVDGIGMTGWDWVNRQSLWVGYDFDSIVTHKEGLSQGQLQELEKKAVEVPWVTLLTSTGGKGIHLYLFLDKPFPTKTHTEHAALARSLLTTLTIEIGFNFTASVDTVGSILWCYHRKQEGTNGLTYIKKGTPFPVSKIPKNWREHIGVCNRTKKKTHSGDKGIESLSSAMTTTFLSEIQLEIIKWISNNAKKDWWWDSDYSMLVCHTFDLKDCHEVMGLRGVFETNSSGSSEQNCFCFPTKGGSFAVRRHGSRTSEARTWVTDESGWTKCTFNAEPSIHDACITNDALEDSRGEYVFADCTKTEEAMKLLKLKFTYPAYFAERQVNVKIKSGRLILKVEHAAEDPKTEGWLKEKKKWIKVLVYKEEHEEVSTQDTAVRHVISEGVEAGWYINIHNNWVYESKSNVVNVLKSLMIGFSTLEIEQMMGKSILDPWALVSEPFQDEYLGNRKWNKNAPQLSVKPSQGKVIHWWELLEHLGSGLDVVVQENIWCQHNSITSGSDYLLTWIAFMVQKPTESLPYLFFFGPQNTGKSSLHEGLAMLFKNKIGYTRADQAIKNTGGFNAEIARAVLCVVEETDLSKSDLAANRIKDWVTGKTISINEKHKNVYEINNTTHWIQCSNPANYCLILKGDTRIVACEVEVLEKEIPREIFHGYLEDELPAFLYEIIHYELPEPEGRLQLPVLNTDIKIAIMEDNFNILEEFVRERLYVKLGHFIYFSEFYTMFQMYLMENNPQLQSEWSLRGTSTSFPKVPPMVKGQIGGDNKAAIGNVSFDLNETDNPFKYILKGRRLVKNG